MRIFNENIWKKRNNELIKFLKSFLTFLDNDHEI